MRVLADTLQENRVVSTLWLLILSARPKQWTKNLVVFFAYVFSIHDHVEKGGASQALSTFMDALWGFLLFCLLTSAVYLANDLADMAKDRLHPIKARRPLASGRLSPVAAGATAVLLTGAGVAVSFLLGWRFGSVAVVYLVTMLAYNLVLKDIVIVDVMTVAGGFVLRAAAGAVAINVPISAWLYVVTSLGALFLGFGKRRNELLLLGKEGSNHRSTLAEYSNPQFMDQLIAVVTSSTLIGYALYTFSADNLPENNAMMLTIPFVLYGILRYLYLIYHRNLGGSPEDVLFTDKPLLLDILLWIISASVILLVF